MAEMGPGLRREGDAEPTRWRSTFNIGWMVVDLQPVRASNFGSGYPGPMLGCFAVERAAAWKYLFGFLWLAELKRPVGCCK